MIKLKHPVVLPVAFFIILTTVYIVSSLITGSSPEVKRLDPPVAFPGENIIIEGSHFGKTAQDGFVIIAGIRPTLSSYLEWTETKIKLKIPDEVGSGRLFVKTGNKISNGLLFTNKEHIPVIMSGPAGPGQPYLESISPEKGFVGNRIDISGINMNI